MKITTGEWFPACDSYGKVRHSRKYDCVATSGVDEHGRQFLKTIAARIEGGWNDAKVIAAAGTMYQLLRTIDDDRARALVAKIEGNDGGTRFEVAE